MNSIVLKELSVLCILGCNPEERTRRRLVKISIELFMDLEEAALSDDLEKTIDYGVLVKKIAAFAENSTFHLIEALAHGVASICLEDSRVQSVDVRVTKPLPCPSLAAAVVKYSCDRSKLK